MNSTLARLTTAYKHYRISGALALLLVATRFHHEGTAFALPDASLAVFFLAGMHLSKARFFLALLLVAFLVDYLAIAKFGVDDYCFSPAYAFLAPTYGVMWLGGRLSCQYAPKFCVDSLVAAGFALALSASLAFLISNASFYWFSGKVTSVGFIDYAQWLLGQYPPYVGAALAYAFLGLAIESLLRNMTNHLPSAKVDVP